MPWNSVGNIKGATGSTGTTGATGQRGTYFFTGTGAPTGTVSDPQLGTAVAGDLYLDTATGTVYRLT